MKGLVGEELKTGEDEPDNSLIKCEERKSKSRKKRSSRNKDILIEEVQNIETADTSVLVENVDSFEYQNTFDNSVTELMIKTEKGWKCTECVYLKKNKSHVQEHVETHIEGYSHQCNSCDKTFQMRKNLRRHFYRCSQNKKESKKHENNEVTKGESIEVDNLSFKIFNESLY